MKQIFPFALIWFLFGLVYVIVEAGLLGRTTVYPSTGNQYNFYNSMKYVSLGTFIIGFVQGSVEVLLLKKIFERKALWFKILSKGIIYLILIVISLIILIIISRSVSFYDGSIGDEVYIDLNRFINSFAFWSIVIYTGLALFMALTISELGEYLGIDEFYNFFLGRYNLPNQEQRIFMFLDMRSSTAIAEKLGHSIYFNFIKSYYAEMTDAIIETSGIVYQYVGDEIVITWPYSKGIKNDNCIECFFKINSAIEDKRDYYLQTFGVLPEFKAGYHIGGVTSGEIGVVKREIVYSGDVLNTAARIQSHCNSYNTNILLSENLVMELSKSGRFSYKNIGQLTLRGKSEPTILYTIIH